MDVCTTLKNTNYNCPKVLKNPPETEEEKLFFVLSEFILKNNLKGNIPLATCLYNYYYKKFFITEHVSGVGHIVRMKSDKYKKDIYLFGDTNHNDLKGCMAIPVFVTIDKKVYSTFQYQTDIKFITIQKYFEAIFETTPLFLDIFLEHDNIKREYNRPVYNFLAETDIYKKCTLAIKDSSCPKNVRIHFTDTRNDEKDIYYYYSNGKRELILHHVKQFKKDIENKENFKQFAIGLIKNNFLVQKELAKLPADLREIIFDLVISVDYELIVEEKWMQKIDKNIEFLIQDNEKAKAFIGSDNFRFQFYGIPIAMTSFIFDLYHISRIFKTYNVSNTFHPVESQYIISYIGNHHVKIAIYVLEKLGFLILENVQEFPKQHSCIDMRKIKQPLFS